MYSYPGPIIVGGGIGDQVFSYANPVLTVGTATYPVTRMVFLSATATIGMGATPGSTGALNVDIASYPSGALNIVTGGTAIGRITSDGTDLYVNGTAASASVVFAAKGGQAKWSVNGANSVSVLNSLQVTARIVGGSTNGLAVRNSGDTRDNFAIADSGATATLTDGTNVAVMSAAAVSGEMTAGARWRGTGGVWLNETSGTAGNLVGAAYWDGTQYRSAWQVANVASGFGTLLLMKSGGIVGVGAADTHIIFNIQSSLTATTGTAVGFQSNPTLVAAANADTLSGAVIGPVFTPGSFTGLVARGLTINSFSVAAFSSPADPVALRIGAVTGTGATNGFAILISPPTGATNNYLIAHTTPATFSVTAAGISVQAGAMTWGGTATTSGAGLVSLGGVTRTTIGANGAATALTALPLGYLDVYIGGTAAQIPYYNRGA